jgi:hypothetical protein
MVERREANSGRQFRAFQEKQHPVFTDGTTLVFGGGQIFFRMNGLTERMWKVFFVSFLGVLIFPDNIYYGAK